MAMINQVDIVISGFTQTLRRETGSEQLWSRLRAHASAERYVMLREWRADWSAIAEHLLRVCGPYPVIRVYAFSWGGGWGFIKLATELAKRGLVIAVVVLCDAVYRSRWMPDWAPINPLSLTRWPKIRIPANVAEVHWFYQTRSRPRGHRPVARGKDTVIHDGIELDCTHVYADRAHQYHELARQIAAGGTP